MQRPDRQHAALPQRRFDVGKTSGAEENLLHLRGSKGTRQDRVSTFGSSCWRQHSVQHRTSDSHSDQNEKDFRNHETQNGRSGHQWILLDNSAGQFP